MISRFEKHTNRKTGPTIVGIQLPGLDRDDTIGYAYTEWVLRADARLYVHGEASDRTGELAFDKPEHGLYLISTRTEDELKTRYARKQKLLAFGGLGGAILGVALVGMAAFV